MSNKKLKLLRIKKNLTLEELAKKANSTKSYIWTIENKTNLRPSAELAYKLAIALGVTMEELIDTKPIDGDDQVFFREYKKLKSKEKLTIRKIFFALISDITKEQA